MNSESAQGANEAGLPNPYRVSVADWSADAVLMLAKRGGEIDRAPAPTRQARFIKVFEKRATGAALLFCKRPEMRSHNGAQSRVRSQAAIKGMPKRLQKSLSEHSHLHSYVQIPPALPGKPLGQAHQRRLRDMRFSEKIRLIHFFGGAPNAIHADTRRTLQRPRLQAQSR